VNSRIARLALAAVPPRSAPIFGVRYRMLFNWLLTSAVPLVGVCWCSARRATDDNRGRSITVSVLR